MKYRASWMLAFAFALTACVPKARVSKVAEVTLPEAYGPRSAKTSARPLRWSEFLADESLVLLVKQALSHNQDLGATMQRIEMARAQVRRATGATLPEVGVGLSAGVRKFGVYTMDGAGNATTEITPGQLVPEHLPDLAVGLQAAWEVDVWGKLRGRRRAEVARYLSTVEGTRLVVTNLVADIATAYFGLLALDKGSATLAATIERQERGLVMMAAQKEAGRVNELAVEQFAAQLEDTKLLREEALRDTFALEQQLRVLTGQPTGPIAEARGDLLEVATRSLPTGVPSDLLENRADIRAAARLVDAAEFDLKAARAAFYPSVTIAAGAGYQAFDPRFLFSTPESIAYNAAGGAFLPLINRSAIRAEFDVASAAQIEALYNYQGAVLRAFVEVAGALDALERSARAVESRRAQVDARRRAVSTAELLFSAGRATYLEVLLAEEDMLSAELQLVEAIRVERVAGVLLYRVLGGGWA